MENLKFYIGLFIHEIIIHNDLNRVIGILYSQIAYCLFIKWDCHEIHFRISESLCQLN